MKKRMFQILDELNVLDGENNTDHLGVCNYLVSANKVKQGATVTIGTPENVLHNLMDNSKNYKAILLIVNMDEYNKIEKQQPHE